MGACGRKLAAELLEVLSVGLPFCVFKAGAGVWCLQRGAGWAGVPLLALAGADALLNLVNLGSLLSARRRAAPPCVLAGAALRFGRAQGTAQGPRADLGNALDVALAFTLVAGMVGAGLLAELDDRVLAAWNGAVVLNVLGAGLSRLGSSLGKVVSAGP